MGVRSHLAAASSSRGLEGSFSDRVLSSDLACALHEHQAALENAEHVWQQAEQFCERNLGEAEVMSNENTCAVLERELTAAARVLYTAASEAASASGSLAEH